MSRHRTYLAFGILVIGGLLGCDPLYGMRVRQSLAPVPSLACIDNALGASPLVREVIPFPAASERDAVQARVRLAGRGSDEAIAVVDRDSTGIGALFTWIHVHEPSAADKSRLRAASEAMLRDVVRACAPADTLHFECRITGPFTDRSCPQAG